MEQGNTNAYNTDAMSPTMTTTTTTTTTSTAIRLDFSYIRTKFGILKCIEIALNLLGFICIISSFMRYHPRGEFFSTVSMLGFWFTGIILVLYLFHGTDKLKLIPWLKIEFAFCVVLCLLYLIASSLAASFSFVEPFAAAAFFGYCAMVAYGYDAFLSYVALQG